MGIRFKPKKSSKRAINSIQLKLHILGGIFILGLSIWAIQADGFWQGGQRKESAKTTRVGEYNDGMYHLHAAEAYAYNHRMLPSTITFKNESYTWLDQWVPYNPSFCYVPGDLWEKLAVPFRLQAEVVEANVEKGVIAITWFMKEPGNAYGTKVFLGITSLDELETRLADENGRNIDWLIEPSIIWDIAGPKAADPRCYVHKFYDKSGSLIKDLAFVAYTILENEPKKLNSIAPYHVRTAIVRSRESSFPACKMAPAMDERPECSAPRPQNYLKGEFFVDCTVSGVHCADDTKLYGTEVLFEQDMIERLPRKNIQPVVMPFQLESSVIESAKAAKKNAVIFVDFSPPTTDGKNKIPQFLAEDIISGDNLHVWEMSTLDSKSRACAENIATDEWRGSTQIVPLQSLVPRGSEKCSMNNENTFVTILHQRSPKSKPLTYRYLLVFLQGEQLEIKKSGYDSVIVPRKCIHWEPIEIKPTAFGMKNPPQFSFAVGLLNLPRTTKVTEVLENEGISAECVWPFAISYGIDNNDMAIQTFAITASNNKEPDKFNLDSSVPDDSKDEERNDSPIVGEQNIFSMWGGPLSASHKKQFSLFAASLHGVLPTAKVYIFSEADAYEKLADLFQPYSYVSVLPLDWQNFLKNTTAIRLAGQLSSKRVQPPQRSDIFRLVALWRWGGSYIDLDDIALRKDTHTELNNMLPYIEWPNEEVSSRWGLDIELIPGRWKPRGSREFDSGFHIQNDPLLNFVAGNKFLESWISWIVEHSQDQPREWGQKVPTEMILSDPERFTGQISLIPQYELLLHPAFATEGGQKKGPMFPPYDFRLPASFPDYDTPISKDMAHQSICNASCIHNFSLVKHSKFRGFDQTGVERDICGWIVEFGVTNVQTIVEQCLQSCEWRSDLWK